MINECSNNIKCSSLLSLELSKVFSSLPNIIFIKLKESNSNYIKNNSKYLSFYPFNPIKTALCYDYMMFYCNNFL